MIHYTCDRCKLEIDIREEARYEIQIEVRASMEMAHSATPGNDDSDHLLEMHELLERLEEEEICIDEENESQQRYDLCPRCYERFRENPMGQDNAFSIGFSHN